MTMVSYSWALRSFYLGAPDFALRKKWLVENFYLFSEHKFGLVKIFGQNHHFLGVNNAIASMLAIRGRTAGL